MVNNELKSWEIENKFYRYSHPSRIKKIINHFEIFKKTLKVPGVIIECGVFKGNSISRFIIFRDLLFKSVKKKVYGFDVFGKFPNQKNKKDDNFAKNHNKNIGFGTELVKLNKVFKRKKYTNFKLIKGRVEKTLDVFIKKNKKIKISFLHLDLDVYKPTLFALERLYKNVSKGGIILLDDYGKVDGATKAVRDFFKKNKLKLNIQATKFDKKLKFIIK